MIVKSIKVKNVRSHDDFNGVFSDGTTVITGKNGSGKTTLLESLYVGLRGKSFKGTDKEMLRHNKSWYRIDLGLDDEERTVKYQPGDQYKSKIFELDEKKFARLPKTSKYPVVLFEPDDLRLLHGSPSRRRRFFDLLVTQTNPEYQTIVNRYEKILKQRNALLKEKGTDTNRLFAWNVSLAKYGSQIISARKDIVDKINQSIETVYNKIAKTKDSVKLNYPYPTSGNVEQRLLAELEANIQKDLIIGSTSVGPHRHDIEVYFNNKLAETSASRGETRTIVLALKFIEVAMIEVAINQKPIVLLDDVFSELDEARQTQLVSNFHKNQIVMTSVAVPNKLKGAKIIKL